jgi:hypothetical protein
MWIECENGDLVNCEHVGRLVVIDNSEGMIECSLIAILWPQGYTACYPPIILRGSRAECEKMRKTIFDMLVYGVSAVSIVAHKKEKVDATDNKAGQDAEPGSAETCARAAAGA